MGQTVTDQRLRNFSGQILITSGHTARYSNAAMCGWSTKSASTVPKMKDNTMAASRRPQIKDVMTPDDVTLSPTAEAIQATKAMKSLNVGVIPICDGKRLLGMVTDRDLVVRVMAEHRNPETERSAIL